MNKKTKLLSILGLVTAILFLFSSEVLAQSLSISGKVIDKNSQEPVIGASVLIEGTSNGTITDLDGNFMLSNVPSKGNLVVSYIGYATQTLPINGRTSFSVVLAEDTETLDEVVVIGYGVQKKVNLTGSVSSVKGDALERRPVADATQSLQGMVPGLLVSNSNTGRPGASGTLTLRGQGNLDNNANPYILVDGVEMSLSDVNPNDIESISVLKDAAACAIYGARAAYGVILVTTKKGEEGKMRVNYQGNVGWSTPTVLPDMVDSYEFAQYWNAGCINAGSPRLYSEEKMGLLQQYIKDPSSVDPWFELPKNSNMNPAFENSELGVGNTNYFDLHYKDWAFKQNHNLSLSGGGKKAQYYISGGYYSEDGILRYADMDFSRYNFAANISSQITDWMKVKVNTKFMHSDEDTPFGDGGLSEGFYHSLARFRPTVAPIDPNGHFTELTMIPYLQSGTYTNTQRDRFSLTAGLDIQPVKNWFIFFDYTYKLMDLEYEALNVSPLIYGADGVSTSKGVRDELGVSPDGKFTRYYAHTRYQSINLYSNYLFTLEDKHNFTVMAGYQEENNDYSYMKNSITGLYSTSNPNVGMGTGDKTVVDTRNGWATRGFFGRVNYDYDGRYLLELNGRYDGSSRFAKGNRWGFFPSASLGWNITREQFMMPIADVVSNLKLRASYSEVGNSIPNEVFNKGKADLATGAIASSTYGYFDNPIPETSKSFEAGFDVSFFDSSLNWDLTYYHTGLYNNYFLQATTGGKSKPVNTGLIRNQGIETTVSYSLGFAKDWMWRTSVNFSYNDNKIVKTFKDEQGKSSKLEQKIAGGNIVVRYDEGGSYGDMYALDFRRNDDGSIYLSSNGAPQLSNNSYVYLGNMNSKFQLGWGNTISWKDLSLYFLVSGRIGGKVISLTEAYLDYQGVSKRVGDARLAAEANPDLQWNGKPAMVMPDGNLAPIEEYYKAVGGNMFGSQYVYDATNFRLAELSLGYSFHNLFGGVISNLSLSVVGRNLFFIYKDAPVDPDIALSTKNGLGAFDIFNMPATRSVGVNLKIDF